MLDALFDSLGQRFPKKAFLLQFFSILGFFFFVCTRLRNMVMNAFVLYNLILP